MAGTATPIRVRVFFDIDGTLLYTDGAGRQAIRKALETVYGTSGPLEAYIFHGKTDPQIVVELMVGAGLPEAEVRRRMPEVWSFYLAELEHQLGARRAAGRITLLPGVSDLLTALRAISGVAIGLLTGNIEEGARLKLAAAGLDSTFTLGGFGSDSEDRGEVARIARRRSRSVDGGDGVAMVVIGDTPEDVACARAAEAHAVAVATGRHGVAELERAGADAVFEDLSDTHRVLDCVLSLAGMTGASADAAGNGGER